MKMMERFYRLYDKIITVFCWGNSADLYMQRYAGFYRALQSEVLDEDDNERKITGEIETAEPTYIKDTEQDPMDTELVKV